MRELRLKRTLTEEQASQYLGKLLTDDSYNLLVEEDCDAYDADTGKCLFKLRKGAIPANYAMDAFSALREAALLTDNRGAATNDDTPGLKKAGRHKKSVTVGGDMRIHGVLKDGSISKTNAAKGMVQSGLVGFFDRYPRFPYCRTTAYTQRHWDRFEKAYPIIKTVDDLYAQLMPKEYAAQRALADITSDDFRIQGTAFTTVTVNKNWQTAVHTDKGDFDGGFGNLVVLRAGRYTGGYFVLVEYGVAINLNNCDILLVDVHRPHGNTPIKFIDSNAERLSLVMYYRENMKYCGTAQQERDFMKRREPGTELVRKNLNPRFKE